MGASLGHTLADYVERHNAGMTNAAIARELGVAPATVSAQLRSARERGDIDGSTVVKRAVSVPPRVTIALRTLADIDGLAERTSAAVERAAQRLADATAERDTVMADIDALRSEAVASRDAALEAAGLTIDSDGNVVAVDSNVEHNDDDAPAPKRKRNGKR